LQELGLKLDNTYWGSAAKILQTHPQDGFETLGMMDKISLTHNQGAPYFCIETWGTQAVKDVLARHGSGSSRHLDDILPAIAGIGQNVVDEIIGEFGAENVRTMSPHYVSYGEDLTREVVAECNEKGHSLSYVYPFYRQLKNAREKSAGQQIQQYEIVFKGEVQGVNFRSTAQGYANICGLTGRVENRSDGTVYCQAQGQEAMVDVFIFVLKERFGASATKKETELRQKETGFHR
jgi:acylphosphatase